ncbi:MAG: DUF434 domain-containing protein [Deltaproteobacteria bacterium]|nr:MAG: DUF434 domain-containing protein [Deltaproteobacteria bacterium]
MEIKKELWEAAEDLRYLLSRGYPRQSSLQLVGNRYNLTQDFRHLLRRGVFSAQIADGRRRKKVSAEEIKEERFSIDGYNVLITIESALKGKTILLADDGFIRDISGVSSGYRESVVTTEALMLIIDFLQIAGPAEAIFLFDSPISGSGELAARIRGMMSEKGIQGDALAVKVPERIMEKYEGIIASSDTAVIDQAERVFDLAGHLISDKIKASYIDIGRR